MKNSVYAALVLALVAMPAHAQTERKRNAAKPDYEAHKKELALEMALIPQGKMEVGQPTDVLLKLVDKKSGLAVPASFMRQYKGSPFHLLLVDGSLSDYQQIYPSPTETDGLYRFTFTPRMPGGYRGWAHVVSAKDAKTQFVMTDLGRYDGVAVEAKEKLNAEQGGYSFSLAFDDEPKVGRTSDATITIKDSAGNSVQPDEIYIAGIHEDRRTLLKIKFEEGSKTEFEMKPTEPGLVRLFMRVGFGKRMPFIVPIDFNVGGKKEKPFKFEAIF